MGHGMCHFFSNVRLCIGSKKEEKKTYRRDMTEDEWHVEEDSWSCANKEISTKNSVNFSFSWHTKNSKQFSVKWRFFAHKINVLLARISDISLTFLSFHRLMKSYSMQKSHIYNYLHVNNIEISFVQFIDIKKSWR